METLKFGKFKGMKFNDTPQWYQKWLLKQDWFKKPAELNPLEQAQKNISKLSSQLRGWNGYSKKGAAVYDAIFEQEKAIENAIYCGCGNTKDINDKYCGFGCGEEFGY